MLRARRFAMVAVLAAALSACGFQLQGTAPLPKVLAVTYLQVDNPQTEFVQSLRRSLVASGARITERRSEATAVVRIATDKVTERILSVSASNIPQEYELTYEVEFAVEQEGREILALQKFTANRDYSFDERELLAKEREKETLSEALARDLAGLAMRRLSVL